MTSAVPDWAVGIPSAPVHNLPTGPSPTRPLTTEQLQQVGAQSIEQFLGNVVLALVGVFIPGTPSFDQLREWAENLPFVGDLVEAITGIEDGDLNDLGTWALNIRNALLGIVLAPASILTTIVQLLQQYILGVGVPSSGTGFGDFPITWDWLIPDNPVARFFINMRNFFTIDLTDDNFDIGDAAVGAFGGLLWLGSSFVGVFFNALTGGFQTNVTVTQAGEQAAALADNQVAQAAQLSALQAAATGGGNNGIVGGDDFERVDNDDLGTGWTITKVGGAHSLAIVDGHNAALVQSGTTLTNIRAVRADPADAETLTTYQAIMMVEGAQVIVSPFGGGTDAQNSMLGRVGKGPAAGSWVRPEFAAVGAFWTIRLLYAVGGVETALNINPSGAGTGDTTRILCPTRAAGTIWQLLCGTATGERNYRIVRNGAVLVNFNDSGNVTSVGVNNKGWGFGLGGGVYTPSNITRVTVADNAPAAMTGTFARISRVNTGSVSFATVGGAVYPASFFDTIDRASPNVSVNLATGSFTVADAGPLNIEVGLACGFFAVWPNTSITPNYLQIRVDGVVVEENAQLAGEWTMQSGTNALSQADSLIFRTTIYVDAGETVTVGYNFPVARSCYGTANGLRTYAKVSR